MYIMNKTFKKVYLHPSVCSLSLRTEGLIAVSLSEGSADPDRPVLVPPYEDFDEAEEDPADF